MQREFKGQVPPVLKITARSITNLRQRKGKRVEDAQCFCTNQPNHPLEFLMLQNNHLSGMIPASIGNMEMAEEIFLSNLSDHGYNSERILDTLIEAGARELT